MPRLACLLIALLTALPLAAAGDELAVTIELKNGQQVQGLLVSLEAGTYRVRVGATVRQVKQGEIRRVTFGGSTKPLRKKSLAYAMTRTAKVYVGEIVSESKSGITLRDIVSNTERALVRSKLVRFAKQVSDDKAVRYAGLPAVLAWKIRQLPDEKRRIRVAVIPIGGAAALSEEMVTGLVARQVKVVERSLLRKVLLELKLQHTPFFDPKTAQKLGRQVGATTVLTGRVVQQGKRADAHVRLIRVATGEILLAAKKRLKNYSPDGQPARQYRRRSLTRLGGGRALPSYLQGPGHEKARVQRDGVWFHRREVLRTKKANYLKKDWTFEVQIHPQFTGNNYQNFMYVGIGPAFQPYSNAMPRQSIYFAIREPKIGGEVSLTGLDGYGKRIGRLKGGVHRVILIKKGKVLTMRIDVDDDGPSPDDIEHTISDITKVAPHLHDKNTHIFIGGGGGAFKRVRLGK